MNWFLLKLNFCEHKDDAVSHVGSFESSFFFSSELLFQQRIQSSPVICDPDSISVCVMKYLEGRTLNIASLKSSNYSDVILLTCSVLKEYFSNESQGKVKHITPESTAH